MAHRQCGAVKLTFAIEMGDDYRRVMAYDWKEAIRIAWKNDPPKELGTLTRIAGKKRVGYIDSIEALKIAGYNVKKEPPVLLDSSSSISRRRRGRLSASDL